MKSNNTSSEKILRFRKPEIKVHWAIAVPFMVCFVSALILVVFYNYNPTRPYRYIFSWIHRISGISLALLPLATMFRSRHAFSLYIYNIKQAWGWTITDIKWIYFKALSTFNKDISLPEQGKFNAVEKINFMTLMCTTPLYIGTGIMIWITDSAILYWMVHIGIAITTAPLILGHIFMATINPETRVALSGMISGKVDRDYIKHHHAGWYREHFAGKNKSLTKSRNSDASSKHADDENSR